MTTLIADRRPAETVNAYFESRFNEPDVLSGTRLPSINALSRHLKVSPSTVQTTIKKWVEEGKIRTVHGSGVFFVKSEATGGGEPRVVAVNIESSQIVPTNVWSGLIAMGILNELSRGTRPTLLRPTKQSRADSENARRIEQECRGFDGAILFANQNDSGTFQTAFEHSGKPVVFINLPAPNATSNFVSTDYYANARRLAEAWIATGRERISLVLHSNPGHSMGALMTLTGFTAAIEATAPERNIKFSHKQLPEFGEADAAGFLDDLQEETGELPDALYFISPVSAEGVVAELRKRGVGVPERISVAAGTSEERLPVHQRNLTVFAQCLDQLGAEAVRMLFWRWDHANRPAPGRYVPCRYVVGTTTRDEENRYVLANEGERM